MKNILILLGVAALAVVATLYLVPTGGVGGEGDLYSPTILGAGVATTSGNFTVTASSTAAGLKYMSINKATSSLLVTTSGATGMDILACGYSTTSGTVAAITFDVFYAEDTEGIWMQETTGTASTPVSRSMSLATTSATLNYGCNMQHISDVNSKYTKVNLDAQGTDTILWMGLYPVMEY